MKYLDYESALKYKDDNKIICTLFTSNECPTCLSFIKDMIEKCEHEFIDDVTFIAIECNNDDIKYPPPRLPITYWHIPNSDMKLITREGIAPNYESMKYDVAKMVEMKNSGKSFNEIFFGTK